MSKMVERVADAMVARFKAVIADGAGVSFEDTKVALPARAVWEGYARAAIEAMREPTTEVLKAHHVVPEDNDFEDRARCNWQAMIDAALK